MWQFVGLQLQCMRRIQKRLGRCVTTGITYSEIRRTNYKDALHYYNLMFAEIETKDFRIACANRSAVLIELGHFEEALEDIELALNNKYPESRVQKLAEQRVRCRELIRKKQEEYLAPDSQVRKLKKLKVLKLGKRWRCRRRKRCG